MKRMLKRVLAAMCASALAFGASAQDPEPISTYFPYPSVPDGIASLSERCNYLVLKFWERCNIKQSFSSLDRLDGAFGDWLSFMPYASEDTVMMSVDKYLADVGKTGADNLLTVGRMAEKWTYCDSAEYYSETLYLPFAQAVAENKKVKKNDREHFARQAKIIQSSGLGKRVPNFQIIKPDGSKEDFDAIVASRVILMLVDPESFDCTLAKARLSADYNLNQLMEKGLVKVVAIYPGAPTEKWNTEALTYPEGWTTGAAPAASEMFLIEEYPSLYYLDGRHKVLGKNLTIEQMLQGVRQINDSMNSAN